MTLAAYKDYLITWIQEKVVAAGARGVVLGLSGGVDSAVVAALAKAAFPTTSLALYMPVGDMGKDLDDAHTVAIQLGLEAMLVDLTTTHASLIHSARLRAPLALANSKSRLRMTALYAVAQEHNYLVLGTSNAAEWHLGYFTKYGDGASDLLPLIHLRKGEVQALAKLLDLPAVIYTKTPTAALWPGQSLQTEHGFGYPEVDAVLATGAASTPTVTRRIAALHAATMHKRDFPARPQPFTRK